jgi:hypothetical protein
MKTEEGVLVERVAFRGHPMVLALHPTTIEVTTDTHLTRRGDCIVGVAADHGCAGLASATKRALASRSSRVKLRLVTDEYVFELNASGDPRLTLTNPHDIVIRKSEWISDRTLAVRATAAAKDIPRVMVSALRDPNASGFLEFEVEPNG